VPLSDSICDNLLASCYGGIDQWHQILTLENSPSLFMDTTDNLREGEPMISPDCTGTAHCSISDIIDVLKSQQEQDWEAHKSQEVDHAKVSNSNVKCNDPHPWPVASPPVSPELWRPKVQTSKEIFDFSSKARYSALPKLNLRPSQDDVEVLSHSSDEENASILNAASVLANGLASRGPTLAKYNLDPKQAVIIMLDKDSKVHLVSTSRENLEGYLQKSQIEKDGNRLTVINKGASSPDGQQEDSHTSTGSESDIPVNKAITKKPPQKRGRKRIHGGEEGECKRAEMKRERNNEACRKFRQMKRLKQSSLMETESSLIEKNLNLKQEIVSLQRQLKEIKARLGLTKAEEN